MEYYWILEQNWNSVNMYWKPDNESYYTFYDKENRLDEDKIIECLKAIVPQDIEYENNIDKADYKILDFQPNNNFLPDVTKRLVVFHVTNGMTTVGPIWTSARTPQESMENINPKSAICV